MLKRPFACVLALLWCSAHVAFAQSEEQAGPESSQLDESPPNEQVPPETVEPPVEAREDMPAEPAAEERAVEESAGGEQEPAQAQPLTDSLKQAQEKVATLDKMVVTATRTERRISQTPVAVSVVTREEIDVAPARNIDDILMTKTGVQMKRAAGMTEGIPSDIIMRGIPGGLASSRALVLVDGIPTNASGTPFLVINEIPLEAIERIEIVRGPYSSLYGANALGGVINVITRTGDGRPGGLAFAETSYPFSTAHAYSLDNGPHGSELWRQGAHNALWNGGVQSSGGNEHVNYMVSAGYRTIGNYLLADSAFVRGPNRNYYKSTDNHDYRDVRFFGKYGLRLKERVTLALHTRYFNSSLGFGKTKKVVPRQIDVNIGGQKILVGPEAMVKLNDIADLRVAGYYRRVGGQFTNEDPVTNYTSVPSYWSSFSSDWQGEAQLFLRLGTWNVVTVGGDYLWNRIDYGSTVNDWTAALIREGKEGVITNAAGYVQDEISLFDKLNIVPGVRYDYHSDFGGAVSPKLAAGYWIIDILRVRGTAGRAFRAPTHSELYMPDLAINPEFTLRSNPNLDPEYLWAFDGALDVWPMPALNITAGGFYNLMNDLIVPGVVVPGLGSDEKTAVTHQNTSDAWSRGIETEAEWNALRWLSLDGNYVFQQSRDENASDVRRLFGETDPDISLDYIPNHSASVGLGLKKRFGKVELAGHVSEGYVGRRSYLEWTNIPTDSLNILKHIKILPVEDGYDVLVNPPKTKLPPYWRTDLSANARLGRFVVVNVTIQNLFNAQFEESGGTHAPGRFASVKVEVEF